MSCNPKDAMIDKNMENVIFTTGAKDAISNI